LIRPLGFSLEDRYLKRAGLDYWPYVDLRVHDDWAAFLASVPGGRKLGFSARARSLYLDAPFSGEGELCLVFGAETRGLPEEVRHQLDDALYRIPIFEARVRSLNLANAVGIVVYEALRQRGALNDR
jgi:tRNA (cytidine/uridine-2'-O-)-methyltransferase